MTGADLLDWLAAWPLAAAMRRSAILYLFVNAAHILSIGLLVGAILPLDLRLAGLFGNTPVEVLGPFLARAAATGAVLAILTGLCLFSVRPSAYVSNPAFLAKLALLAFGLANALLLHLGPAWRTAIAGGGISPAVRLSACLSLVIWPSVILAGRWIGFL